MSFRSRITEPARGDISMFPPPIVQTERRQTIRSKPSEPSLNYNIRWGSLLAIIGGFAAQTAWYLASSGIGWACVLLPAVAVAFVVYDVQRRYGKDKPAPAVIKAAASGLILIHLLAAIIFMLVAAAVYTRLGQRKAA